MTLGPLERFVLGCVEDCIEGVELPSESDIEHAAEQRGKGLVREDGRPILIGRDTPTNEQLAEAENWSWERMVGAHHCPACNAEGCDACQMTGWEGGREP